MSKSALGIKEKSELTDDESRHSSSPFNLDRPISRKWAADDELALVPRDRSTNKSKSEALRKGTTQEEASATSSCSCEDHSSIESKSEDLNEDLDYDEDSVTSSPADQRNEGKSRKISSFATLSDRGSSHIAESDKHCSIETKQPSTLKKTEANQQDDVEDTNVHDETRIRPQIRSFINRNCFDEIESCSGEGRRIRKEEEKARKAYSYLLKHFFKDACYFQIKSINHENVELSKLMGVWSTPVQNEIRLNAAFNQHRNVILIFSVQQSGAFQGFARMVSESRPPSRPVPWILPERLSSRSLGGVLKIEWLCKRELPFSEVHDLYNPFNENKPVKIARDGQQVEPKVGKKLCKLFPEDSREQLLNSISTLKRQVSQRKRSVRKNDTFYPLIDRRVYPLMPSMSAEGEFPMSRTSPRANHVPNQFAYQPNFRPIPGRQRSMDMRQLMNNPYATRSARPYINMPGANRGGNIPVGYIPPYPNQYDQQINSYNTYGSWPPSHDNYRHQAPYQRPARR